MSTIVRDRDGDYGDAVENWIDIARAWSAFLGVEVTPQQAIGCMILVKLQRLKKNSRHADSVLDIGGYADVWERLNIERR